MFAKIKGLFSKVDETKHRVFYDREDWTNILTLCPKYGDDTEEVYLTYTPVVSDFLCEHLKLDKDELEALTAYGNNNGLVEVIKERAITSLQREVERVLGEFYEENKGKVIMYSPLGHPDYRNTISGGWYLIRDRGEFHLHCCYRVAEVV